jgi:hypothetical protein
MPVVPEVKITSLVSSRSIASMRSHCGVVGSRRDEVVPRRRALCCVAREDHGVVECAE